jgi:hypothetical protein
MDIRDKASLIQYVEAAKSWYISYIKTGHSPQMTVEDKMWLENERTFLNR